MINMICIFYMLFFPMCSSIKTTGSLMLYVTILLSELSLNLVNLQF